MRKTLLLFILFLWLGPVKARPDSIPEIDASAIKINDLLWDLEQLSRPPEMEWTQQKGPVQGVLDKSADYKGKATEVFAWYSNPDMLRGRPASGKRFPAVVLVHGGGVAGSILI